MKRETKIVIGEILLLAEGTGVLDTFLDEMDLTEEAYLEAKQDFNKTKTER